MISQEDHADDAFWEGVSARRDDTSTDLCPYEPGTLEWRFWQSGYAYWE